MALRYDHINDDISTHEGNPPSLGGIAGEGRYTLAETLTAGTPVAFNESGELYAPVNQVYQNLQFEGETFVHEDIGGDTTWEISDRLNPVGTTEFVGTLRFANGAINPEIKSLVVKSGPNGPTHVVNSIVNTPAIANGITDGNLFPHPVQTGDYLYLYTHSTDVKTYCAVATRSGDVFTIDVASITEFLGTRLNNSYDVVWDSTNNLFVAVYKDDLNSAYLTARTINWDGSNVFTLGTPVVIEAAAQYVGARHNSIFSTINNKVLVASSPAGAAADAKIYVLTVSGTDITADAGVTYYTTPAGNSIYHPYFTFDENDGTRFMLTFTDTGATEEYVYVAMVDQTGDTVSLAQPMEAIYSGGPYSYPDYMSSVYDEKSSTFLLIFSHYPDDTSPFHVFELSADGSGVITIEDQNWHSSRWLPYSGTTVKDPTTGDVYLVYTEYWNGHAIGEWLDRSRTAYEDIEGVLLEDTSVGQEGRIVRSGSIASVYSGLTVGTDYYFAEDLTLTTTPTPGFAGAAVATDTIAFTDRIDHADNLTNFDQSIKYANLENRGYTLVSNAEELINAVNKKATKIYMKAGPTYDLNYFGPLILPDGCTLEGECHPSDGHVNANEDGVLLYNEWANVLTGICHKERYSYQVHGAGNFEANPEFYTAQTFNDPVAGDRSFTVSGGGTLTEKIYAGDLIYGPDEYYGVYEIAQDANIGDTTVYLKDEFIPLKEYVGGGTFNPAIYRKPAKNITVKNFLIKSSDNATNNAYVGLMFFGCKNITIDNVYSQPNADQTGPILNGCKNVTVRRVKSHFNNGYNMLANWCRNVFISEHEDLTSPTTEGWEPFYFQFCDNVRITNSTGAGAIINRCRGMTWRDCELGHGNNASQLLIDYSCEVILDNVIFHGTDYTRFTNGRNIRVINCHWPNVIASYALSFQGSGGAENVTVTGCSAPSVSGYAINYANTGGYTNFNDYNNLWNDHFIQHNINPSNGDLLGWNSTNSRWDIATVIPSTITIDPKFKDDVDNYTILAADIGKTLRMTAAISKTYTLPTAPVDGFQVTLAKMGAGPLVAQAGAGEYIMDSSAAGTLTNSSSNIGENVTLQYVESATIWIIVAATGTWVTA